MPDEEVKRLIAARCKPSATAEALQARCQLLKGQNLEVARDMLHGTEVEEEARALEEKRAVVKANLARAATGAPSKRAGAGAESAASSSNAVPKGRRRKVPWPHAAVWSASEASTFLPAGGTISKELLYHVRWKGAYRSKAPPNTVSTSYSEHTGATEQAMLHVLAQLWCWHHQRTGEECPYDLSAAIAG